MNCTSLLIHYVTHPHCQPLFLISAFLFKYRINIDGTLKFSNLIWWYASKKFENSELLYSDIYVT